MGHHHTSLPDGFNTDRLPTLPHVLLQIIRLCRKPALNLQRLAEAINRDAILAGRVVAAANAAYYNSRDKVTSVERALLVLGADTIKTLVITLSVKQVFERFPNLPEALLAEYWRRSLNAALLAKSMAALIGYHNTEEAYFAALLHRTGELVLHLLHGLDFVQVKQESLDECDQLSQERIRFGYDHLGLSTQLAEHWGLDSDLIDALAHSRGPTRPPAGASALTRLVYGARELSLNRAPSEQQLLMIDQLFGLMPPLVADLCKMADTEVEQLARSLQIHVQDSLRLKRQALAEELEVISLLQTTRAHLMSANSERDSLLRLRQAAAILFEASNSVLFLADPANNTLVCEPQSFQPGLELRIPLQPGNNLAADAYLYNDLTGWWPDADDQPLSWADRQVWALLQTPGFVCLPLTHSDATHSVLVLGLHARLAPEQRRLMSLFADEVVPNITPLPSTPSGPPAEEALGALPSPGTPPGPETRLRSLDIIRNYLDVLRHQLNQARDQVPDLANLRAEVERAADILLNLSQIGPQEGELQPAEGDGLRLDVLLAQLIQAFSRSIFAAKDLSYELVCDESLPLLAGNDSLLRQILVSLLRTTADTAEPGAQILISARPTRSAKGRDCLQLQISSEHAGSNGDGPDPQDHRLRLALRLAQELGAQLSSTTRSHSFEFILVLPTAPARD